MWPHLIPREWRFLGVAIRRIADQIYIHIKGGVWSERRGGVQFDPSPFAETGSVGWMDSVELIEGHESGNTTDTSIDQIWVTLK